MRYLSALHQLPAVVYFQTAGLGYYTLQAQNQGLLCVLSRIVLLIERLPEIAEKKLSGDQWMNDLWGIKDEYLARKAAELAVNYICHLHFRRM